MVGERQVHTHRQWTLRNPDAGFDRAAFGLSAGSAARGRGAPEMPDAVGTLTDFQHYVVAGLIVG
jgi:hypothetical protein